MATGKPPLESNLLLEAMTQRIKEKMEDKLIEMLRTEVRSIVNQVAKDFEVSVARYYSDYGYNTIKFIVENRT